MYIAIFIEETFKKSQIEWLPSRFLRFKATSFEELLKLMVVSRSASRLPCRFNSAIKVFLILSSSGLPLKFENIGSNSCILVVLKLNVFKNNPYEWDCFQCFLIDNVVYLLHQQYYCQHRPIVCFIIIYK